MVSKVAIALSARIIQLVLHVHSFIYEGGPKNYEKNFFFKSFTSLNISNT